MAVVEGSGRKVDDPFRATIRRLDRRHLIRKVFFLLIKLVLLSLTGFAVVAFCPDGWRVAVKAAIWLAASLVIWYLIDLIKDGVEHNYPEFDLIVDYFNFRKETAEEKEAQRLKFAEYNPDYKLIVSEDGRMYTTNSDEWMKKAGRRYYAKLILGFTILIGGWGLSSIAAIKTLPENWPGYVKIPIACVVWIFILYLADLAQDGLKYRKKQREQAREKQLKINKK